MLRNIDDESVKAAGKFFDKTEVLRRRAPVRFLPCTQIGMFKLHRSLAVLTVFVAFSTVLAYQGRDTKQETLPPAERLLWVDPGDPATRDFVYGVGGPENQPKPPFRFVKEDLSGTRAKVNVVDARGVNWN